MSITPNRPKWKGTMTDRERFNRQMHYQSVDRCFNMEFGYWSENFTAWPLFTENGITNNGEADIFFSFDRIGGVGGNIWISPPFPSSVVEETETTRIMMDGNGLLAEVPKDGHDTIPHYIKATIQTPEDWKRAKEERFRRDDPARQIDVEKLQRQHPPDRDYALGVGCGVELPVITLVAGLDRIHEPVDRDIASNNDLPRFHHVRLPNRFGEMKDFSCISGLLARGKRTRRYWPLHISPAY